MSTKYKKTDIKPTGKRWNLLHVVAHNFSFTGLLKKMICRQCQGKNFRKANLCQKCSVKREMVIGKCILICLLLLARSLLKENNPPIFTVNTCINSMCIKTDLELLDTNLTQNMLTPHPNPQLSYWKYM